MDCLDKKGFVAGWLLKGADGPLPPKDMKYSARFTLWMQSGKWRYDYDGMILNLDIGALVPRHSEQVWDGNTLRSFEEYTTDDGVERSGMIVDASQRPLAFFRETNNWPLIWFLAPFEFDGTAMCGFGTPSMLEVLPNERRVGRSGDDLVGCTSSAQSSMRLWLNVHAGFLVEQVNLGRRQISVAYSDDDKHGPVPTSWSVISLDSGGEERRVTTCRVVAYELNPKIAAEVFQMRFPAGTKVWDQDDRLHIADVTGRLVNADLGAVERKTAYRTSVWLVMCNAAIVIVLIVLVIAFRRRHAADGSI